MCALYHTTYLSTYVLRHCVPLVDKSCYTRGDRSDTFPRLSLNYHSGVGGVCVRLLVWSLYRPIFPRRGTLFFPLISVFAWLQAFYTPNCGIGRIFIGALLRDIVFIASTEEICVLFPFVSSFRLRLYPRSA